MKISMRFEGGQEFAAALNSLPPRVRKKTLLEVLKDVGEPMRSKMATNAPREPGAPDLADNMVISTATKIPGDGGSVRTDEYQAAVAIGPAKAFFYGLMQEFGTVNHGPQAFARPAFDSEALRALSEIGRRLWVELAGRGISRSRVGSGSATGGPGGGLL